MNDILVPADPADLIDRIIEMQLRIEASSDAAARSELVRKRELLSRLAARILPGDEIMTRLTQQLFAARSDLFSLTRDLRACDMRKDYGTAFVALSQSMLAALVAVDATKERINAHFALTTTRETPRA